TLISMGFVAWVFYKSVLAPLAPYWYLQVLAALNGALSFFVADFFMRMVPDTPTNTLENRLGKIMVGFIMRFAFTEASLILLLISNSHPGAASSLMFYGMSVALMVFHFPSDERVNSLLPQH